MNQRGIAGASPQRSRAGRDRPRPGARDRVARERQGERLRPLGCRHGERAKIPADANVAGFGANRLGNAAAIVNAASAMGSRPPRKTSGCRPRSVNRRCRTSPMATGEAINPDGSVADSSDSSSSSRHRGRDRGARMDPPTPHGCSSNAS